jgi:HEAT repeat protein
MITYYCPSCWQRVQEEAKICPHCQAAITEMLDQRSYEQKLIAALGHSLPSMQVWAAWVLGQLRAEAAVEPLLGLLAGKADPYTKAAAVEALGKIGDPRALPILAELAADGPVLLRRPATEALEGMTVISPAPPD